MYATSSPIPKGLQHSAPARPLGSPRRTKSFWTKLRVGDAVGGCFRAETTPKRIRLHFSQAWQCSGQAQPFFGTYYGTLSCALRRGGSWKKEQCSICFASIAKSVSCAIHMGAPP